MSRFVFLALIVSAFVAAAAHAAVPQIGIYYYSSNHSVGAGAYINIRVDVQVSAASPSDGTLRISIPPGTTYYSNAGSIAATCVHPAVGASGELVCSGDHWESTTTEYLTLKVDAGVPTGAQFQMSASVSSTTDTTPSDNVETWTVTVIDYTDIVTTLSGPSTIVAGTTAEYTATVTNSGANAAKNVQVTFYGSLGVTPAGWTCITPGPRVCTISTLAAGAGATFVFQLATNPLADKGSTIPIDFGSNADNDSNASNNSKTIIATIDRQCDVSMTASAPATVAVNADLPITFKFTATGPSLPPRGFHVDYTTPPNVVFVSSVAGCAGPSIGASGTITCSVSSSLTPVTITVRATKTGETITNSGTVSSTQTTDTNLANNTASATTTIGPPAPDIAVAMSASNASPAAGTPVTYTVTVRNVGTVDATSVTAWGDLPSDLAFVSSDTPCTVVSTTISCNAVGTLTPGSSKTFHVVANVSPGAGGSIVSTFFVATPGEQSTYDNGASATINVIAKPRSDLGVTLQAIPSGPTYMTYNATIFANGPDPSHTARITLTPPSGTLVIDYAIPNGWPCTTPAHNAPATAIVCTPPLLQGGPYLINMLVMVQPTTVGPLFAEAEVSEDEYDPVFSNNRATTNTPIVQGVADLGIAVNASPSAVRSGDRVTVGITVSNSGPDSAQGIVVSDSIPEGAVLVAAQTTSGSCTGSPAVTCKINSLLSGATAIITITINAPSAAGSYQNVASVNAASIDTHAGNNAVATPIIVGTTSRPDLTLDMMTSAAAPAVDAPFTFTLVVRNDGSAAADNVIVEDTLPPSLSFVSASAPCTASGQTIRCSAPTMAPGASLAYTITAFARSTASIVSSATASTTSDDADPANNSTSITIAPVLSRARGARH